jgi:uncharacterized repeat protein (TIGR01451 family)/fimbrial isopeptide formation D2 family protein
MLNSASRLFSSLLLFLALMGAASTASAGLFCSEAPFFGVVDGTQRATYGGSYSGTVADPFPTQITIDQDCTFQNFPTSDPLTATLNFQTNDPSVYLITFNNVIFTGNMACANIDHRIWFVNGADYGSKNNCQDLFIPVEAINKQNPPGTTTVGIGEPFTYTLNVPVLYDPATGTFLDNFGSANDLHSITIVDDLSQAATGVDLSLVGTPTMTWLSGPSAGSPVPFTFTNVGGVLTFEINPAANPGVIIPAGDQLQIAITVVLNNTPVNAPGTQFFNTATWEFGRLIEIDGVPTFFDPLPGENGVTEPLTIGAPNLVVNKTNPDTAINIGNTTTFTIDVQNTGSSDAWDVTILDLLPDTTDVGMCDFDPTATVTAQVFAADGVTPVSGVLNQGADYSVSYTGAPTCELSFTTLSTNAVIGPTERLIITYQSELDPDTVPAGDGVDLINIAGATQWYSADDAPGITRVVFNRTLTDGTPGVADHQDNHTITAALTGYLFQKTVENITSSENPAITAAPGDRLRYRLRLFNFTEIIDDVTFTDTLNPAYFDLTTFNMVVPPPGGATFSFNNTTGLLQITGNPPPLNLTPPQEFIVEFEIDLLPGLANGTVVPNQARFDATGPPAFSDFSDDPFVNGVYDPTDIFATPDSTNVIIQAPGVLSKADPAQTAYTIGDQFTYTVTVPATPVDIPLYDVRILDDLSASGADMTLVGATVVSGGSWILTNTGTASSLVLEDLATGIDIPANGQVEIDITVELANTLTNQQGVTFSNTASYTYNRSNGNAVTQTNGGSGSTAAVTVLEPNITTINKIVNNATPNVGDVVRYSVTLTAEGSTDSSDVFDITLTDTLDIGLAYEGNPTVTVGGGVSADNNIGVPDIIGDGITTAQTLVWGLGSTDASDMDIQAGTSITISYDVRVLNTAIFNQTLANSVVAEWTSNDGETSGERDGSDGIGGLNDYITAPVSATLTTPPQALDKQNTQTTAAIGVPFTYRIVVPATPQSTALYDVRILDDLSASAADLSFVSVTRIAGSQPWTPVNTGTATNLVIEDPVNGIDIPAGEQITIDITVVLNDSVTNVDGLSFTNTADYTFNQINSDITTQVPGLPDTTAPMTIGEPGLTLQKTGPPTLRVGIPGNFTLNIHNPGPVPAYDMTITDLIPNPTPGGMCDDTAPANFVAQITLNDLTPVGGPLVQGTDYVVNFTPGGATCTLSFTMLTPAASLPADNRLIITYDAYLDADTLQNVPLTNIAGVTEWFSGDTAGAGATGEIRTYTRTLSDGTPAVLDHEDAYTLLTELPVIAVRKTVTNWTTGQSPGLTASPGDVLQYEITITNFSAFPLPAFALQDEIDRLNASPMFVPGQLTVISAPATAVVNINPTGGTNGTGVLDVSNLTLGAAGSGTDVITIVFQATLAPILDNGTIVLNQAEVLVQNLVALPSDDPNVNGPDDPVISGDEDPTPITITSAPVFQVQKVSDDITGLATELLPGDTLRYTITIKNIGNENAVNTVFRDLVPANTTYVANSTTLNGTPVTDPAAGVSPLESGILINAPENTTPGYMRADASATTSNVATIVFDVTINSGVVEGTVISNQGYVNADGTGGAPIVEQPSDDPATVTPNDPTLDIVGNLPLVDAQKIVELYDDVNGNGQVDPGDTLRYTITITNNSTVPATGVRLVDPVPVDTTYVTNSTYLNGEPVGQPDGGVSPLIAGIDVSSADQTPPLPTPGNGYLSPGNVATVIFDVTVNALVAPGTVITNQGVVSNNELPDEPTDADGDDSNGDQPTLIVVGNAQQLEIVKTVFVVGGGTAQAGSMLEYEVTVTNVGLVPAYDVVITDNLDLPVANQMTYVVGSATLNGSPIGTNYSTPPPIITADYGTNYGPLPPGQTATLRFRVVLNSGLAIGTTVTNIADVTWNAAGQSASDSVTISVGGVPGVGTLTGQAWHDANFNNVFDATERVLAGWTVELYRDGNLIGTVLTDANGVYQLGGVPPNYITLEQIELRFIAPGATSTTALLGLADSVFTNGLQYITDIIVTPGSLLPGLNLPIDPNGVVYDSVVRSPIAGATLTMVNAVSGAALPASCFDDAAQQNQITLVDGYYKFDINFSQAECPAGADYLINVTPPAGNFIAGVSSIIPPTSSIATAPFSVPACLGSANDAVPGTANICEVQTFETAPALAIAAGSPGTNYHLHLTLNNNQLPGESQLFNNHLPLDPDLALAVGISKVSSKVNVTRGDMVPYTITINNTLPVALTNVTLIDTIPAGFKYVTGSARLNGVATEPVINGLQLSWQIPSVAINTSYTVKLLLVVGAGVKEGEYINRAQVFSALTNGNVSEQATATVRVVPSPVFDCSDIIGKVFDDKNLNGHQDEGEHGIQGVRLATARGLLVTTDKYGRFHITCAAVPDEQRGSNFIIKLDDRTLPSGFRVTTENPRVQRLTRGKFMKFNFGATVHRVVRLDVADGVFEKGSDQIRPQWKPRIGLLLEELRKAPSVLRLVYLGDVEQAGLVEDRLDVLRDIIKQQWEDIDSYKLVIEQEIFWRNGSPGGGGGLD